MTSIYYSPKYNVIILQNEFYHVTKDGASGGNFKLLDKYFFWVGYL